MKINEVLSLHSSDNIILTHEYENKKIYTSNIDDNIHIELEKHDNGYCLRFYYFYNKELIKLYAIKTATAIVVGGNSDDYDFNIGPDCNLTEESYFQLSLMENTFGIEFSNIIKFKNIYEKIFEGVE